jgi:hypothetical protein
MALATVHVDFAGGNGAVFDWPGPDRLRFEADLKGGPVSMWFHFRVEDPACNGLHCELANGKTALGWPYRPHVRPVYRRPGATWQRTPPTTADKESGRFEFAVPCDGQTVEVAYCYPYQLADWEEFLRRTLQPAGAEIVDLGKTGMGRPYFACRLDRGPRLIWVAARAHSGETPGSYTLEGMLAEIAAARGTDIGFMAVPFIDLDGVAEGMYGKNRPPLDFNRAWCAEETRPEIRACREYLARLSRPPLIAVDLHAPTPYDSHYISHSPTLLAPDKATLLARAVDAIVADAANDPALAMDPAMTGAHLGWFPQGEQHTMCGHIKQTYGAPAFAVENAYHATHCGAEVGPGEWRRLGRLIARHLMAQMS